MGRSAVLQGFKQKAEAAMRFLLAESERAEYLLLHVAAVAKPDAYAGELPVAYVQKVAGSAVTEKELADFALEHVPERPAVPKEIVFLDAMPLTDIGKPDKVTLRFDAARRAYSEVLSAALDGKGVGLVHTSTDRLRGRLAVRHIESGEGWQKSLSRPEDRLGEQDKQAGRATLADAHALAALAVLQHHVLDVQMAGDLTPVPDLRGRIAGQNGRIGQVRLAALIEPTKGHQRIDEALLDGLGLSHLRDRSPDEISLGEQQRTAIARALILGPRLLLADEPTAHQDAGSTKAVMQTFRAARADGTSVLLATHNLEILPYMDRVLGIRDGRVGALPEEEQAAVGHDAG